jgi:SET domain-containing protein
MFFNDIGKNDSYFIRRVEVRPSSIHGIGVFATEDIPNKYSIECSPVVLHYPAIFRSWADLHGTRHVLHDYVFTWYDNIARQPDGRDAMPLGYVGIYNNSFENPNAQWKHRNGDYPALMIVAMKDIKCGEEILVRYHPDPDKYGLEWSDASTHIK